MAGTHIYIHKDGRLETPGVDYGKPLQVQAFDERRGVLAVKILGHTGWASIGRQRYYSPRLAIWRLEKQKQTKTKAEREGAHYRVAEVLIEWSTARKEKAPVK